MKFLFFLFFLSTFTTIHAQEKIYTGKIVDMASNGEIPYATVVLISNVGNRVISGTTTDDEGRFKLISDSSDIFIRISFIGYIDTILRDFDQNQPIIELGTIQLVSSIQDVGYLRL